jgi:hypothetical protein
MPSQIPGVLTVCALIFAPAAARAQAPKAATTVAPVTVEAAPPKVVERQTRSFVQSFPTPIAKIDQIGRWHEPVCVQVVGLVPDQASKVKARVEAVARAVGLQVRKPGCISNIQIVATSQPQILVDKIAAHNEHDLGFHWRADLDKVKAVTHPIQAWYKTATQGNGNTNGTAFAHITSKSADSQYNPGSLKGESNQMETVDIPENGSPGGCADSHFSGCLRSLFKNVIVVVDSRAVQGADLGTVSDYLALLALSRQSLDGCNALPSIVDVFAKAPCPGRDPPDGLTAADAAYLTALYASDPEGKLGSEQSDIGRRMADILIKANAGAQGH